MRFTPGMMIAAGLWVAAIMGGWFDAGTRFALAVVLSVVIDMLLRVKAIWLPAVWYQKFYYRKGVHTE